MDSKETLKNTISILEERIVLFQFELERLLAIDIDLELVTPPPQQLIDQGVVTVSIRNTV